MQAALALKQAYQSAYMAFFGRQAPEVRISVSGGFFVRKPVSRHYSGEDFAKVVKFFQRGVQ